MSKSVRRSIICAALIATLALTGEAESASNSFAFQFMSSHALQTFCSTNNGYFTSSEDGSSYTCVKPNGDNYTCTSGKHCAAVTYGAIRTAHPKLQLDPQNLAATFSSPSPGRPPKER